jgi:hypothetical protein
MNEIRYVDQHEREYRKTGRLLTTLFILFIPIAGGTGYLLGRLFDSELALFLPAGIYMAALAVLTVRRFMAYYRWTGKYPFYWLVK